MGYTTPEEVIATIIVLFIVAYLFSPTLAIILLFFGFIGVILLVVSASQKEKKEEERIRALKLADVDNMDGAAFEKYIGKLLGHQGFSIGFTPSTDDKGVDIVATKGDLKYAIQVKRSRSAISRRAVSDAVAGKYYYDCNASMVITNNYFTKGAIELSEAAECRLVDRDELTEWIIDFQSSKETEASADVKKMVKVNTSKGSHQRGQVLNCEFYLSFLSLFYLFLKQCDNLLREILFSVVRP